MSRAESSFDFGFDLDDVLFPCAVPLIEELKKAGWVPSDFTIDKMASPVLYEQFGRGEIKTFYY